MSKEKTVRTALNMSRILRKHSSFYAFNSQKIELHPHSFFFDGFESEVMFSLHENPRFGLPAKGEIAPVGRQFQ